MHNSSREKMGKNMKLENERVKKRKRPIENSNGMKGKY